MRHQYISKPIRIRKIGLNSREWEHFFFLVNHANLIQLEKMQMMIQTIRQEREDGIRKFNV
jgi:hypothetical protein